MTAVRIIAAALFCGALMACGRQAFPGDAASTQPLAPLADEIPEFVVGSTMEDVSQQVADSATRFFRRTGDREEPQPPCVLTHQFTLNREGSRVTCMSADLFRTSAHYFVFANDALEKVIQRPIIRTVFGPQESPWDRAAVVLDSPPLCRSEIARNVQEDFKLYERQRGDMEPNPVLGVAATLFPSPKMEREVKSGHEVRRWILGESSVDLNSVYGPPLRTAALNTNEVARIYEVYERCNTLIAAVFKDDKLDTLFSHDFFMPLFWLDKLGEKHSPPWNPFEILRDPPQQK